MHVIVGITVPRPSALQTLDEWLEPDLADPAFRAEWNRTALARAVSHAITRYRTEHGLSQTTLGEQLGMSQTQISRLELGEHTPSFETLLRIAQALDLEISLTIGPKTETRRPIPKALQRGVFDATDQVVISVRAAR
ncbi:MAG: helix-turn-helix domain-containing protein [Gaiellales bacterium]